MWGVHDRFTVEVKKNVGVFMHFSQVIDKRLRSSCPKQVLRLVAVILTLSLLSVPSFAQGNLGRIFGTVTDQTGGAVAGATVTVIDVDRGISRPLVSDGAGEFDASSLIPGKYTVRFEAKGFKIAEQRYWILTLASEKKFA